MTVIGIDMTLPWPPSMNSYYGSDRTGRKWVSRRGVDFREVTKKVVEVRFPKPMEGRLALRVAYFPPTRRKYDIDNYLKPLLDALERAGAFENDEQIDQLEVRKSNVCKGGHCWVEITRMNRGA